jgi:hypothetical protein
MTTQPRARALVTGLVVSLGLVTAAAVPVAAQKTEPTGADDLIAAAATQQAFYDALVSKGVPREVAALVTVDTQIVLDRPNHVQFVQTMIGGIRREVDIRLTPGPPKGGLRVPIMLDDGGVMLGERVTTKDTDNGYETSGTVYLPDATASDASLEPRQQNRKTPWWLDLLGIGTANAQAGVGGVVMSYGDSFVGAVGNAVGVSGMTIDSVVDVARNVSADPTVQAVRTAGDVASNIASAMETAAEGPKTLAQTRLDTAGNVLKALKYGYKVYSIVDQDAARRKRLQALDDCADNPTERTAIRAMTEDANYRRATTDVIADARRNLNVNTALRVLVATANAAAGEALKRSSPYGSTMAKGVSYLGKVEDRMLQHVADEYIMKDAGKGVVPCKPECGPVYQPAPPPEQLASYPPSEMTCSEPQPEALVCSAAPPSSSANLTPGPAPPATPPPGATCGVLTHAEFTYTYESVSSGCSPLGCGSQTEERHYAGSADLHPDRSAGYQGRGPGFYSEAKASDSTNRTACSWVKSDSLTEGPADLIVNAYFSIDNNVTGGIDTSAVSDDTSVVEILTEGKGLHQQQHSSDACDPPQSSRVDGQTVGFDCHFYGIDLDRPGFYRTYKDGDPQSGVCTLTLSR